jgi:hypothetical protein
MVRGRNFGNKIYKDNIWQKKIYYIWSVLRKM